MTAPMQTLPQGTYGILHGTLATPMTNPEDQSGPPVLYPANGTLTFTPYVQRVALTLPEGSITLPMSPIVVDLDANGQFAVSLIATDNDNMTPVNWTYRVSFQLGDDRTLADFSFELPAGETTDITSVTPLQVQDGIVVTQGPKGPAGPAGPAGPKGASGVVDVVTLTTALGEIDNDFAAAWGTSLVKATNGGSTPWINGVGADLNVGYLNGGQAGWSSTEVVVRQGGLDLAVTVSGGQIPASGSVAVTVTPIAPGPAQGVVWRPLVATFPGPLAGVAGALEHDSGGTADPNDPDSTAGVVNWVFRRTTAGAPVSVPAPARFHCTDGDAYRNAIQVFWLATNNPSADPTLAVALRDQDLAVRHLPATNRRFVIIGEHIRPGEGATQEAIKRWWNTEMARRFPDHFIDLNAVMSTYGIVLAGITPTSADLAKMAAGRVPQSLLAPGDSTHFGPAGYDIVRRLVTQFSALHAYMPGLRPVAATTQVGAAPTASNVGQTSFTVSWPAITDATAYQVQVRKAGASTWLTGANTQAPTRTATLTNLSPGLAYEVRVVPYDIVGAGAVGATLAQSTAGTPAVTRFSETFDRTPATNMGTVVANNGAGGSQSVTLTPSNNFAGINALGQQYLSGGSSSTVQADIGFADGALEVDIATLPTAGTVTLQARTSTVTVDTTSVTVGYSCAIGATGTLQVRVNPGTGAVLLNAPGLPAGSVKAGDRVRFTVVGSTVQVRINDVLVVDLVDTQVTTGTRWGWIIGAGSAIDRIVGQDK